MKNERKKSEILSHARSVRNWLFVPLLTAAVMIPPGAMTLAAQSDSSSEVAKGLELTYEPPLRGAPSSRVGAGTRGIQPETQMAESTIVEVLAPEHTGLTISPQPTLYWYVSQKTRVLIEVAIDVEGAYRTVLRIEPVEPSAAGIHAFELGGYNQTLATDTNYLWSATIVKDPAEEDTAARAVGAIRRISAPSSLTEKLGQTPGRPSYYIFAEEGIWYDAVETLSRAIDQGQDVVKLRELRAALMEQVRLPGVAAFDRNQ